MGGAGDPREGAEEDVRLDGGETKKNEETRRLEGKCEDDKYIW